MRFLIIGGSDEGISAALHARELSPDAEVAVLLEDAFPNYSICGLPFYLTGKTPDWHRVAHRTEFEGIDVHRQHGATHIDPLACVQEEGRLKTQVNGKRHFERSPSTENAYRCVEAYYRMR